MVILFVLGVALLLLAILLVGSALSTSTQSGVTRSLAVLEAMTNAPKELSRELDKPFAERVLEPLQARAVRLGRRLSGADTAERIRRKLDLAGNPAGWTVDRVLSGKVIGAVAGLVGGLVFQLMLSSPAVKIVIVLGAAVVGFFAPNLYLYQKAHDRAERLQRDLPDAIDLLTISVESGLGFDAAVQQVARNTEGPLAEEFSRVLREMQIGQGRAELGADHRQRGAHHQVVQRDHEGRDADGGEHGGEGADRGWGLGAYGGGGHGSSPQWLLSNDNYDRHASYRLITCQP